MTTEKFLTPSEVQEILSCSPHVFRELVNSRSLVAYRINGRILRVKPSDLMAFLDRVQIEQDSKTKDKTAKFAAKN